MLEKIRYDEPVSVKVQLLSIDEYPAHFHNDFQLLYVIEGELQLELFYMQYVLSPGSIHIIHPGDIHSLKKLSKSNLVLIMSFKSEFFQKIFPHFDTTVFITTICDNAFAKTDVLRDQLFSIVSEQYYQTPGYASRINNISVSVFNTLINNFRGFVIDETDKSFNHRTSTDYIQTDRISRIIQYVYENYPYRISLTEIAEKEKMSPYYLSHIFHKLVGLSFRDFLSMVRVEMSLSMIMSTNKSITQISQETGFSDAKYYVSTFYNYFGCHPKEYRQKKSDRIFGVAPVVCTPQPLDVLKPIIGEHTQLPVFRDDITVETSIHVDFAVKSRESRKPFADRMHIMDRIYSSFKSSEIAGTDIDLTVFYKDSNFQRDLIELLTDLTDNPSRFTLPAFTALDNVKSGSKGLLTVNGLKKPLYHFLKLASHFPESVLSHGNNHIVFQSAAEELLLVFNPSETKKATIDIVARNLSFSCKLVKYKLPTNSCCMNYLAQLNFSFSLDEEDYNNINAMSAPSVSYEILPGLDQYFTSIELNPLDIAILDFKHL